MPNKEIVEKDSVVVKWRYYRDGEAPIELIRYFYGRKHEDNARRAQIFVDGLPKPPDWYGIYRTRKIIEHIGGSRVNGS
jgi:hypothetical protein